ncbi:MAG: hypothetical protein KKA60_11595 [Proteobacteria bacterium]|nr:hypothetical protein [Pseudomonadota bacterium]
MTIKKIGDPRNEKIAILRVTIPKRLLDEIREVKKLCKERGFSFDIKPDVAEAIEGAIAEARKTLAKEKAD